MKQTIEIFLAGITSIGVVAGAIFAFGALETKVDAEAIRTDRIIDKVHRVENSLDDHYRELNKILVEIRDRTARMEQWQRDRE